ncbi:MAG: 50S ribosomal protein L4 [Planctomycetes bacterium]|nr:50S ribosomal protein L4 [Planctomycetota bacterium]
MASLIIHDRSGKQVGTYQIEPADLAPRISRRLLHQAVVAYQANDRQGTFRSKSRADVRGSTKKMYRQKGTGNARAGSRRSGVRRGGGHIFAKRPRDFSQTLPRKAARAATRMALATKIRDEQIVLIDQLQFDAPATKQMAAIVKALKCNAASLLVTTEKYDVGVYKSARNIAGVTVSPVADLNALSVTKSRLLLMTPAVLDALKAASKRDKNDSGDKPKQTKKPSKKS